MAARLKCERCGAGLVPAVFGLRCPRFAACGRSESGETARSLRADLLDTVPARDLVRA